MNFSDGWLYALLRFPVLLFIILLEILMNFSSERILIGYRINTHLNKDHLSEIVLKLMGRRAKFSSVFDYKEKVLGKVYIISTKYGLIALNVL